MSLTFGKPEIVVDGVVLLNEKKSKGQVAREKLRKEVEEKKKKKK